MPRIGVVKLVRLEVKLSPLWQKKSAQVNLELDRLTGGKNQPTALSRVGYISLSHEDLTRCPTFFLASTKRNYCSYLVVQVILP